MSSKSKNKGKSWERDVCLFLSDLYVDSFIRVPGSGAFIGGSNQFRKEYLSEEQIKLSRGDIIPPVKYPYFLAECKNYAEFPFHQLIVKSSVKLLDTWIEQVEHDVTSEKDVWLLFIKITRKGQYVLFNTDYLGDKLFPLPYGVKYKKYWFCEMEYFFKCFKDELDLKWRDYGREAEKN
jgi:hypothetical protein